MVSDTINWSAVKFGGDDVNKSPLPLIRTAKHSSISESYDHRRKDHWPAQVKIPDDGFTVNPPTISVANKNTIGPNVIPRVKERLSVAGVIPNHGQLSIRIPALIPKRIELIEPSLIKRGNRLERILANGVISHRGRIEIAVFNAFNGFLHGPEPITIESVFHDFTERSLTGRIAGVPHIMASTATKRLM